MDREDEAALDRILHRTAESALTSLATVIDVERRLRDLHRSADDADPADDHPEPARSADE